MQRVEKIEVCKPTEEEARTESLCEAAKKGDRESVTALVQQGADINLPRYWNDRTPLMTAAEYGHKEVVTLLLELGAEVNVTDKHGLTALIYAAFHGNRDCVTVLLEAEASVSVRDNCKMTALDYAAMYGRIAIVRLLLEHGAMPTGNTLQLAGKHRFSEVLEMLEQIEMPAH